MAYRTRCCGDFNAMVYRTAERITADELCSCLHMNIRCRTPGSTMIADFLGLSDKCIKWITPCGQDMTSLTECSGIGGFGGAIWRMEGWVLDKGSLMQLRAEFPERYDELVFGGSTSCISPLPRSHFN